MPRGRAARDERTLKCQLGTLGHEPWCRRPAVAAIGAIRICEHHLEIVRAMASDSGMSDAEVTAELGRVAGPSNQLMRAERKCEQCPNVYMAGTRGRVSPLCPECRELRDAPKPRREPKPEKPPRPTHATCCDCPKRFEVARLGPIPIRCPDCRLTREHKAKCTRKMAEYHAKKGKKAA